MGNFENPPRLWEPFEAVIKSVSKSKNGRYMLVLGDNKCTKRVFPASQLFELLANEKIKKGTKLLVKEYVCTNHGGSYFLMICEVEILE